MKRIVEELSDVTDNMRVTATSAEIKFEAVTELTNAEFVLDKGSDQLLELSVEEPSTATFNLLELNAILRPLSGVAEILDLWFSKNMPLKLSGSEFAVDKGTELDWYLAPRVEAE